MTNWSMLEGPRNYQLVNAGGSDAGGVVNWSLVEMTNWSLLIIVSLV